MSEPTPSSSSAETWWHTFFDNTYAEYGLANDDEETIRKIVDFLVDALKLAEGTTMLDQCCGIGRLALPLAARGVRVIGVDRVAGYIKHASEQAQQRRLPAEFHCDDAFAFVAPRPCDAAINWFTSFGYVQDDSINIQMIQRAFESLRPGGRFALDYLNMPRVFAEFRPQIIDRPKSPALEGLIVLNENRPDFARGMLDSDWTFIHPDGRRETRQCSTRMYMPHEIIAMLHRCGFADVKLYGSIEGEPLDLTSRRCIAVARKAP